MKNNDSRRPRTNNVKLQALEVFCEVVRLQSFSRGAAVFGISQSAASQLVAHLEGELGFQLIDRKRRPLAPTADGKLYYLGCRDLLHRHRATLDEIHRRQKAVAGTVRVAAIYSVGLHTLSLYIRTFMSEYRGSTVHLEYFHPSKVYSAVLDGEADIGVISYPRASRSLQVIPWLEEEMVLVCPRGHRLGGRKSMRLEDLSGEKFVTFDGDLQIRREIDRALRNRHVSVEVVSEFDNIETIKQALEISEAVSILPRPSVQREVERGTLVEVLLDGVRLTRPVGIIRQRKRRMTPTTQQFVATLTDQPA
jgi:DNA-binding transcriptional LysR family regulator